MLPSMVRFPSVIQSFQVFLVFIPYLTRITDSESDLSIRFIYGIINSLHIPFYMAYIVSTNRCDNVRTHD